MPLFDFFKDTIFLKENSDLQNKYDALMKLNINFLNLIWGYMYLEILI